MGSLPQGIHNAVCVGIVVIGTLKDKFGYHKKIVLLWEVCIDNYRKITSREYTFSFDERAKLRKHLESWRGGAFTKEQLFKFQIRNVLGVPCRLEIRKFNIQKYVENVLPFPKNTKYPIPESKYIYFDITDKKTYPDFKNVPLYLIDRMKQSSEYEQSELNGIRF